MAEKPLNGGKVNYYLCYVNFPRRSNQEAYQAECEDIITNLDMNWDEGCEFKAIWRTAAARQGTKKAGHTALYDAQKRVHYALSALINYEIKAGIPEQERFSNRVFSGAWKNED